MSADPEENSNVFDTLDFDGRMSAIATLVREHLAALEPDTATSAEISFQVLTNAVRRAFYRDYSLWDAEFDAVERIVRRTIAETTQSNKE